MGLKVEACLLRDHQTHITGFQAFSLIFPSLFETGMQVGLSNLKPLFLHSYITLQVPIIVACIAKFTS
jgi:hypothetical protein